MAVAVNPINLAYGRGVAALRTMLHLSQGDFGKAVGHRFGDDYDWSQATVSEIENGKRPLQADEIEILVVFLSEQLAMDEEEVRHRLRPHLRLVRDERADTVESPAASSERSPSPGRLTSPVERVAA